MKLDKNTKVADWYLEEFPDDDFGPTGDATFADVIDCIENDPDSLYDVIGVGDSVVRERVFTALSKLLGKNYNDIYDKWMDPSAPSIVESVDIDRAVDFILEGYSLADAMSLTEDTITPETIEQIEQLPGYKKMKRDIEFYHKACTDVRQYRDKEFKRSPIYALEDEADFCKEVSDFINSLRIKGFSPEKSKEIMQTLSKYVKYLNNSYTRLKNILKKQSDADYLRPDGSVNVNTNQKPADYARRALRTLRDVFELFGTEWDYDPDYYARHPEEFAELDKILRTGGKAKLSYEESKSVRAVVDAGVKEGLCRDDFEVVKSELNLTEAQAEYFDRYVYYLFS